MVSKKLVDDRKTDRSQFEHLNSHLKARISYQEHRMDLLFKEVRQCLPDKLDQAQVTRIADEAKRSFDPYYVMFTDQFRGDRNTVMNRFEIYLSFFGKPNIETEKYPVLDVGCGRGEWMELMKDRGFHAKGIDINSILIEQNLVRGLNVARADFKNFLPELPDGSQGTITAFHLIEHISLEDLFFLLNEILRALKPGGRAIFETPNPENILVGSANFYMDPTHRNPIPAALMKFLMEQRGFSDVEIIWLNPYPETNRINDNDSELAKRFNQFFYGPQDYGVIGIKA